MSVGPIPDMGDIETGYGAWWLAITEGVLNGREIVRRILSAVLLSKQVSTTGHVVGMDRIKVDHGLAQVRNESERWNVQQHRLGVSFKQGHRAGFWDGVGYTLAMQAKVDELDIDEWLAELDKGEDSLYFTVLAPDPTRRVYCPGDDAFTVIDRGGVCDACGYNFREASR